MSALSETETGNRTVSAITLLQDLKEEQAVHFFFSPFIKVTPNVSLYTVTGIKDTVNLVQHGTCTETELESAALHLTAGK